MNDYESFLKYFKESAEIRKSLDENSQYTSDCLSNIGLGFFECRDYKNAVQYFEETLEEMRRSRIKNNENALKIFSFTARSYLLLEEYEKSIEYSL